MTETFEQRLAQLADAVRVLDGGQEIGRDLIRLATDMESYLEERRAARDRQAVDVLLKWNAFVNTSIEDAHRSCDARLDHERRRLAQRVAGDPRWQGGYADALALLEKEQST